jgi:hypothetical protein
MIASIASSKAVGSPKNDTAELLEPIEVAE